MKMYFLHLLPPQDASHHENYYILVGLESRTKPSFVPVTTEWRVDYPMNFLEKTRICLYWRVPRLRKISPLTNIWVFPKIGVKPAKWMVNIMENPMNKWMIWGEKPLFLETPCTNMCLKVEFIRYQGLGSINSHDISYIIGDGKLINPIS